MRVRRLAPLAGRERDLPRPSNREGNVRMVDIQMVWDTVIATIEKPRGARRRTAIKHGVVPATITEAIRRFEAAMDVMLFSDDPIEGSDPLTAHGYAFARHGSTFLDSYQILRKFVQNAETA